MKEYNFLAFDIGATSGRAVLGTLKDAKFEMKEIHRFPNPMVELHGRFYWDIYHLYTSLIESLTICARQRIRLHSIGIDTWGVDFGYVALDGSLLGLPRAYRDPYTDGAPEDFFKRIPKEEVYKRTGIQVMPFNSLFQLFRAGQDSFIPQEVAEKILFIPDLLAYMLTERMVCEYTIASTSQLLNPETHKFDYKLLEAVGVSPTLMCPVVMPGTLIGRLSESIARKTGIGEIPVIAVAGHDTASAVAAVPASSPNFAYLSSGTWSLMGIEVEKPIINEVSFKNNFTNEGGIEGTTRFLKNITGMWILERCREQWKRSGLDYSYDDMVRMAELSEFTSLINPDDPRFANPENMLREITAYCEETGQAVPESVGETVRCIYESLALKYRYALEQLEGMTGKNFTILHILGGGANAGLLCQMTADACRLMVKAGPVEATALGNILIQLKALHAIHDIDKGRRLIAVTEKITEYAPQNRKKDAWENAYHRFVTMMQMEKER